MKRLARLVELYLKEDRDEIIDGIGDCVVVLTNLAELHGVSIEFVLQQHTKRSKVEKVKWLMELIKKINMSSREISDARNGITRKTIAFRDPVVENVVDKFVKIRCWL